MRRECGWSEFTAEVLRLRKSTTPTLPSGDGGKARFPPPVLVVAVPEDDWVENGTPGFNPRFHNGTNFVPVGPTWGIEEKGVDELETGLELGMSGAFDELPVHFTGLWIGLSIFFTGLSLLLLPVVSSGSCQFVLETRRLPRSNE